MSPQVTSTLELKAKGKIRWEYEFARIRFTLGKKTREKLLDRLGKYNGDLKHMLGNSEKLADSRLKRRSVSFTWHHAHIRDHAHGLHELLLAEWRCDCRLSHNAHLLLEHRATPGAKAESGAPASADLEFNVLLYFGEDVPDIQKSPWTWHETRIQVSAPLRLPSPAPSTPTSTKQPPTILFRQSEQAVPLACVGSSR